MKHGGAVCNDEQNEKHNLCDTWIVRYLSVPMVEGVPNVSIKQAINVVFRRAVCLFLSFVWAMPNLDLNDWNRD